MSERVVIYMTVWCPYCAQARATLEAKGVAYREIDIEIVPGALFEMMSRSGRTSVPQIFIDDQHVGGADDLHALEAAGRLDPLLK